MLSACSPFVFLEDEFQFLEDRMGDPNRHGLTRNIPTDVKREVRKRCGYGCVRCGLGFYDYEHFAPDFKDATHHEAAGITLLCMQCNQKRARNQLSAETVALANANPICLQQGFAREEWGFGHEPIEVKFGGVTFINVTHLIVVNGTPIMSVAPPEEGSAFFRMSASFCDSAGESTLEIKDNEWFAQSKNWDVECVGQRITIKSGPKDISIVLRSEPPRRIVIEKLNMFFQGCTFIGTEDLLKISNGKSWSFLTKIGISNSFAAINIDTRK